MQAAAVVTPGEVVVAGLACAAGFIVLVLAGIAATRGFRRRR